MDELVNARKAAQLSYIMLQTGGSACYLHCALMLARAAGVVLGKEVLFDGCSEFIAVAGKIHWDCAHTYKHESLGRPNGVCARCWRYLKDITRRLNAPYKNTPSLHPLKRYQYNLTKRKGTYIDKLGRLLIDMR